MKKITIQQQGRFIELESYQNFLEQKEKLQAKYPNHPWKPQKQGRPFTHEPYEGWWDEWLEYKKEITDLMFCTNCDYQQFLWDIKEEREEIKAHRAINGYDRSIYYTG